MYDGYRERKREEKHTHPHCTEDIAMCHNEVKAKHNLKQLFFSKEKQLPWVGFESTTLCSLGILGERSTS